MSQEPLESAVPDYGAPPVAQPAAEPSEPARMGPMSRIANIFFSPGEVFEDVRRSARDWWLPMLLLLVIGTASGYVLQYKLDLTPERLAAAAVDSQLEQQGKTRKDLPPDQQEALKQQQQGTELFFRFGAIVALVFVPIFFFAMGGVYFVMTLVAQMKTTFFRILSVVAYAYFVPNVIKAVLQAMLAFLMNPDNVDPAAYLQAGGIITASPAALVSFKESPVLFTMLSYFDVFTIWFLVLVAIGLTLVGAKKMKMGTALLIAFAPYVVVMIGATLIRLAMS